MAASMLLGGAKRYIKGNHKPCLEPLSFLNEVHKQGVEIFYVSNRYAPVNLDVTIQNFKELGFPSVDKDHVLLFEKDSDKQPRFDAIAKKYYVVLYMGDNAGDFPIGQKVRH